MSAERVKDVLDFRSKRAKEVVKAFKKLDFAIAILSDDEYILGPYELIRLVNIIYTSKRIRRSLNDFGAMLRRRDDIYENQLEIIKGKKEIPH
ncbi:unnamed protein product [marine sediment metagenome]|uniref:Uncharacterized protein n=1 Tax=marine sediment metagenome TaxID=412755 RepID=X1SV26_9ZZZZ